MLPEAVCQTLSTALHFLNQRLRVQASSLRTALSGLAPGKVLSGVQQYKEACGGQGSRTECWDHLLVRRSAQCMLMVRVSDETAFGCWAMVCRSVATEYVPSRGECCAGSTLGLGSKVMTKTKRGH